jgi:hypothetical protein
VGFQVEPRRRSRSRVSGEPRRQQRRRRWHGVRGPGWPAVDRTATGTN